MKNLTQAVILYFYEYILKCQTSFFIASVGGMSGFATHFLAFVWKNPKF